MIIRHQGKRPRIDPSAYVAPNAVVSGDVEIGPGTRICFGAVVSSEGSPLKIGSHCVVMENAVIKSPKPFPTTIGDFVLLGPHSYVTGATVEDRCFLATGSAVFPGVTIRRGSSVAIGGIVHIKTEVPPGSRIPIKHIAVGTPMRVFPPQEVKAFREVLAPLDFFRFVFGVETAGVERAQVFEGLSRRYSRGLGAHLDDRTEE